VIESADVASEGRLAGHAHGAWSHVETMNRMWLMVFLRRRVHSPDNRATFSTSLADEPSGTERDATVAIPLGASAMTKLSKDLGIALLAASAACLVAPTKAATFKTDGYVCYEQTTLTGLGNNMLGGWKNVKDLKACFVLCEKFAGCVAVQWTEQSTATDKWTLCNIFGGPVKKEPNDPRHLYYTTMHVCLKPLKYPGGPQDVMEVPPKIPHDQYRQQPGPPPPQPGPPPGGRRR
jgi:hypothetical protein